MTNLGLWKSYIDEREMLGWYKPPEGMRREARAYRPDGHEMNPLSGQRYLKLHEASVAYARQSVAPFDPPHHNDVEHFAVVEAHGMAALSAYVAGRRIEIPTLVRQSFALALRLHDAHHCASTLRNMAPHGVFRPDLGVDDVSSEWVTALAVNDFMRSEGLNLPARLFQTGVIWSSTVGGQTRRGKQLKVPTPRPRTVWGAIMRASDVCPPESFRAWVRRSVALNYGEVPAELPPRSIGEFVRSGERFAQYIESCFVELDRIAGLPLTTTLGWQTRLSTVKRGLASLKGNDLRVLQFVQSEAMRYGVHLP